MHRLSRQTRFSVNPFLNETEIGCNSYTSKPSGEGLALYFAFWVELLAEVDKETGFVVNVVEIDKVVRSYAVPQISDFIKQRFINNKHISLVDLFEKLKLIAPELNNKFGRPTLAKIGLELNPFRKIAIELENNKMAYFSEKFEFAAMHKLWNNDFTDEKNFEVFGKCANPSGHGHNYVIEVTVENESFDESFRIGKFEQIVSKELIDILDHKNLNVDVQYFSENIPTVENIAVFAWEKLSNKIEGPRLSNVTVWESDRTSCSYCG